MMRMLGNLGENQKLYFIFSQWRIKYEGQVRARFPGRRPWGCISTLCSYLKTRFYLSRNFDQSMLKNANFLEKYAKIASASGAPLSNRRLPPVAGDSALLH